jgi:hypothetical protein
MQCILHLFRHLVFLINTNARSSLLDLHSFYTSIYSPNRKLPISRPPSANAKIFQKLPIELWRLIASHLPPSAAASLTLTCYQAVAILGTQYWEHLNKRENVFQRLRFLEHLDIHFPNHILCPDCAIYHPRKTARINLNTFFAPRRQLLHHPLSQKRKYTWSFQSCGADGLHNSFGVLGLMKWDPMNWTTIHLIHRYLRLGPSYGIQPLPFEIREDGWCHTRQIRVIGDSVVVRVRSIRRIPSGIVGNFSPSSSSATFGCEHGRKQGIRRMILKWCQKALNEFTACNRDLSRYEDKSDVLVCHFCPSQACISILPVSRPRTRSNCTHVLKIERWIDFGECKASDPTAWWLLMGRGIIRWPDWVNLEQAEARRPLRDLSILWGNGETRCIEEKSSFLTVC